MKKTLLLLFILLNTCLFSQEKWNIKFYNEVVGHEVFIFADNNEEMPMSAQFDFKLKNLTCSRPNNEIVVIPAKAKKFIVAKLASIKPNESNSFSYTNSYNFGNALQESFDDDYIYALRFNWFWIIVLL